VSRSGSFWWSAGVRSVLLVPRYGQRGRASAAADTVLFNLARGGACSSGAARGGVARVNLDADAVTDQEHLVTSRNLDLARHRRLRPAWATCVKDRAAATAMIPDNSGRLKLLMHLPPCVRHETERMARPFHALPLPGRFLRAASGQDCPAYSKNTPAVRNYFVLHRRCGVD